MSATVDSSLLPRRIVKVRIVILLSTAFSGCPSVTVFLNDKGYATDNHASYFLFLRMNIM